MKHYEDFFNEAQQYEEILRRYEEHGEVFTDPNFIPTNNATEAKVEFDDEKHTWQRIDKFYKAPLFKKKCITEDAIQQGELGTCYFIASLSRIARQPELVELLFDTRTRNQVKGDTIENQDSINLKCGAVIIYFHAFGKRTPVLIDTLIPFQRGTRVPRFSHPTDINYSPWFCLVEKAYAKLHGSYSAIISGKLSQAIYHLFGYYPCYKNIDEILQKRKNKLKSKSKNKNDIHSLPQNEEDFDENEYLFSLLMKWQYQNAVLGADILLNKLRKGVTEKDLKDNGLVPSHAYLIVKVRREEGKNFICLRNPWGNHEWLGDWSDTSILWTSKLKRALGVHQGNNGTFWMIADDFFRYFSSFDIAKPVDPEYHNKSIMTKLLPGDTDGHDIFSKESQLSTHQTFVIKMKNVHIRSSKEIEPPKNDPENPNPIPIVRDLKVYITIEKRSPFVPSQTEDETEKEDTDPKYQAYIFYSNGKKIEDQIPASYYGIKTNCGFYRFTIHVRKNMPFVIVFQRNDKRDYTEECYVRFSSKYDFDLFDYDFPENLSKEDENMGVVFNNESKRYSNISRKIVIKNVKGQDLRGYESDDLSEANPTFYKQLKLNSDSETSTGFFEYSISDDSSSHRKAIRRNKKDFASLLDEAKKQIEDSKNELSSILSEAKEQTQESKDEIASLLSDTRGQIQETKEELSSLINDTKRQTQETKNEIKSLLNDAKQQAKETEKEQPLQQEEPQNTIEEPKEPIQQPLQQFFQEPKEQPKPIQEPQEPKEPIQQPFQPFFEMPQQEPHNQIDEPKEPIQQPLQQFFQEPKEQPKPIQEPQEPKEPIQQTFRQFFEIPQQEPQNPIDEPKEPIQQPLQQFFEPPKPIQEPFANNNNNTNQQQNKKEIKEPQTQHPVDKYLKEQDDPNSLFNLGLMYSKGHSVAKDPIKGAEYYQKSAELGNSKAQYNLGLMYNNGDGIPQNKQKAVELFEQSAQNGNHFAQTRLGNMYYNGDFVDQNYEKAIDYYNQAVAQNDPEAQVNLGIMYDQGNGVQIDKRKAADLYSQAANNGSAKALFNLGYMNETGVDDVFQKNIPRAVNYYQQASDRGVPQAMVNLGLLYLKGEENLPQNFAKAAELFEKGVRYNDPNAMLHLGLMYSNGQIPPGPNKTKAAELFKKASDLNNPSAQYNLGLLYSKGEGVEKNPREAAKYYQKAADQNLNKAKFNLGVLLYRGAEGVPQNKQKAAELFEEVSDKNSKALFNLAVMYEKGDGVNKNVEKAFEYYQKAADLNNRDAFLNLAYMYESGTGCVQQDKEKAFNLYRKASELGSDKASTNIGLMFLKGEGCKQDKDKARGYFEDAAINGNPQAELNLGLLLDDGDLSDQQMAMQYFQQSADKGCTEAMIVLARKSADKNDFLNAKKYYEQASIKGNKQAQLELSDLCAKQEDPEKPQFYYKNNNNTPNKLNDSASEEFRSKSPSMMIKEDEDLKIEDLSASLEDRVKNLHSASNKETPYNDLETTLDYVNNLLVDKALSDKISDYSEANKAIQTVTNETANLISQIEKEQPNITQKPILPSLNKTKSLEESSLLIIEEEEDIDEDEEEISSLKTEVQLLQSKLNRIEANIREETNSNSNSPRKVQSPKEMTTYEILKRYCVAPRPKRSKIMNMKKKAEEGDAHIQYLLGACYARGEEVPKSLEKALDYYLMAARNGDPDGQYAAACCYFYGKGTAINKEEAVKLFSLAAEQGHAKAQFAMGHFYEFGKGGLSKNFEKAMGWYRRAANNGHEAAIERIKKESSY